ncbi:MAG: hypothetical protein A2144_02755 [Chloroflexi bacterium RBG_16_50_9]|nr:MAG: hypothetical protein A2144_02755 [Chloroflexi bacterium RBG_16_50_9]
MSITFSVSEIFNIAINIERRGITFYDIMAKSTDDEMARYVFRSLVEMERAHIEVFQDMLAEADKYEPRETSTEDYAGYLNALIDNAVFTEDMLTSEMATQIDSDIKALELGINAEKDSILFYYQIRDIMPRKATPAIDRVISEEKSHLQQLADVKKKLATK